MNYTFGDKVVTKHGQHAVVIKDIKDLPGLSVVVEGSEIITFLLLSDIQGLAGEKRKSFVDCVRGDTVDFEGNPYTIAAVFKEHFVIGTWDERLSKHACYYDKIHSTYFLKVRKKTVKPISNGTPTNNSRLTHLLTED